MKISLRLMIAGVGVVLAMGSLVAQEVNRPTAPKAPPSPLPPLPPLPGTLPSSPRPASRAGQFSRPSPPVVAPAVGPSSTVSVRPVQPGSVPALPPPQGYTPAVQSVYQPPKVLTALAWDAAEKEYVSKAGELNAPFTFWLTNVTAAEVSITSVRTSCGCTVAKLPSTPWLIAPGKGGPIEVTVNLAGKSGLISKAVTVESPDGTTNLLVKVNIGGAKPSVAPAVMNDADRLKNMQLALADRQVLFKNQDCAKCHAEPARGLTDGHQLYTGVCGVCHDSHIRASMVPDLRKLTAATDAEYWRNWINYGRAGSMMPAFAHTEGGPLTEAQVEALVKYVVVAYPSRPAPQKSAAIGQPLSPSAVSSAVAVPR